MRVSLSLPYELCVHAGANRQLAAAHGNPWEYRRLRTVGINVLKSAGRPSPAVPWLDGGADGKTENMGSTENTAQVTPVSRDDADSWLDSFLRSEIQRRAC